jgi:hypothetical protein
LQAREGKGRGKVTDVAKKSQTAEEKYADDVRNLHEAYQVPGPFFVPFSN